MSLAVSHRPSQHIIATSISPMDSKNGAIKIEDNSKDANRHPASRNTPPRSDPPPTVKEPPDPVDSSKTAKGTTNAETTQPLAPPPRPAPAQQNAEEGLDYFSGGHSNSHFSREPNPFEQSFGNPSSDNPSNKSLLPPVAALTSPAPLAGEGPSAGGYGWGGSLRSGPLSPAMLGGPVGAAPGDYFDPSLRGSFPSGVTPNESSLRTGLTPGGGGSMFPAPSPSSQALYQHLASGGATPSTLDFHRTAMNAAAVQKGSQPGANSANSRSDDKRAPVAPMDPTLQQQTQQSTFEHDNDAANGLFLLAQAGNGAQANNQFAVPNTANTSTNSRSHETSPQMSKDTRHNGSIGGQSEMSGDMSDSGDQGKSTTRTRGKRTSGGKVASANGKRRPEETPAKQASAKKQKNNNASMNMDIDGMDSEDDQPNIKDEQYHLDGKKMTDEEKRKNFLERNRVAALKCRQRKKQWLANLQAKVEIFSSENDSLSAQVASLREEIVGLKTLLLQHKDCPVSQQQGLGGYFQQQQEFNPHANPYGMGMQNGQGVMAGQRR